MTTTEDQIKELKQELARLEAEERAARQSEKGRPVVITTEHRGVFFGYTHDTDGDKADLTDCRMCVYWSADVKGVMGLASHGPTEGCRISRPVAEAEIRAITAVLECNPEAAQVWEEAPWSA